MRLDSKCGFQMLQGTLDVILLVRNAASNTDPSNPFEIVSFKNEMHADVFFLKVMGNWQLA